MWAGSVKSHVFISFNSHLCRHQGKAPPPLRGQNQGPRDSGLSSSCYCSDVSAQRQLHKRWPGNLAGKLFTSHAGHRRAGARLGPLCWVHNPCPAWGSEPNIWLGRWEQEGHSFRERHKVSICPSESAELSATRKSPGKTDIKINSFSSPRGGWEVSLFFFGPCRTLLRESMSRFLECGPVTLALVYPSYTEDRDRGTEEISENQQCPSEYVRAILEYILRQVVDLS